MILFLLWMILRVVPHWGVPHVGEPESTIDDIKWMMTTVGLTWITLFLYNHFHGWYRLVNWGSTSWCPRRGSLPETSHPMTFRAEEMRGFMDYVHRMENRILELEGRVLPPSPPYSDEINDLGRSRSSVSADDGSDSSAHGGTRPEARRVARAVPPPPPPLTPNRDASPPEGRDPPNAQPDPPALPGPRTRNRRPMRSSSSSNSSSRGRSGYYAVRGGPFQGVYTTWGDASQAIGRRSVCQRFNRYDDALDFVEGDPVRFGPNQRIYDA